MIMDQFHDQNTEWKREVIEEYIHYAAIYLYKGWEHTKSVYCLGMHTYVNNE